GAHGEVSCELDSREAWRRVADGSSRARRATRNRGALELHAHRSALQSELDRFPDFETLKRRVQFPRRLHLASVDRLDDVVDHDSSLRCAAFVLPRHHEESLFDRINADAEEGAADGAVLE